MPANKKYLSQSRGQRIAKFTAGFIGGYLVAMSFHLAVAAWFHTVNVVITSTFSAFLLWAGLMIVAYLGKNGWKMWGWYLLATAIFLGIMYIGIS